MNLSVTTIALFLFLIPGYFCKFTIYQRSIIKRPIIDANVFYSTISILIYSSIVLTPAMILMVFALYYGPNLHHLITYPHSQPSAISASKLLFDQYQGGMNLAADIHLAGLWGLSCWFAYLIGSIARAAASRGYYFRSMLYGPLANLYKSNSINVPAAFIVTKIEFKERRVMYAGFAEEIGLGNGATIEYIVLKAPQKFYMKLDGNNPSTTFRSATAVGSPTTTNLMFISKEDIENIHFQDYTFGQTDVKASKIS